MKGILFIGKVKIGQKLLWGLLAVLAVAALFPVIFLIAGSIMGDDELGIYLGAVISGKEGYVNMPLLPRYPTLSHFVEIFLDSPAFFCDVLEFD